MTRELLISLCEKAIVPQNKWRNQDSAGYQKVVGKIWVLLKAGCEFEISCEDKIIWVTIKIDKFSMRGGKTTFFLPTEKYLDGRNGSDW